MLARILEISRDLKKSVLVLLVFRGFLTTITKRAKSNDIILNVGEKQKTPPFPHTAEASSFVNMVGEVPFLPPQTTHACWMRVRSKGLA